MAKKWIWISTKDKLVWPSLGFAIWLQRISHFPPPPPVSAPVIGGGGGGGGGLTRGGGLSPA